MAKEIESLDQRIRDRAERELKKEINDLAEPLRNKMRVGHPLMVEINGKNVPIWELLDKVQERLHNHFLRQRQDAAVEEFIEKVANLQAQIDELQGAA